VTPSGQTGSPIPCEFADTIRFRKDRIPGRFATEQFGRAKTARDDRVFEGLPIRICERQVLDEKSSEASWDFEKSR
jgi:hypothetical protein